MTECVQDKSLFKNYQRNNLLRVGVAAAYAESAAAYAESTAAYANAAAAYAESAAAYAESAAAYADAAAAYARTAKIKPNLLELSLVAVRKLKEN